MSDFSRTSSRRLKLEVPDKSFIPYACHYSHDTILTKDGDLLKTIKITGFSYDEENNETDLRQAVREALLDNVESDAFALWFHTVRRKRDLDPSGSFDNIFVHDLHAAWCNKNYWHDKFVNELYITVVIRGIDLSLDSVSDFIASFSFPSLKHMHFSKLDKVKILLDTVVDNIATGLASYGAKILKIVVDPNRGPYSENLQFFDKIIHLREHKTNLPLMDLSNFLTNHKMAFGNQYLEVIDGIKKHYAAILSIKEYHDVGTKFLDEFLRLPIQFVVSESLNFIEADQALKYVKYQDYILDISGDTELKDFIGITDIIKSNRSLQTDYASQQLTIMILKDSIEELEVDVKRAFKEFSELGILVVQEDINLEKCFWSQLPGNFSFITRKAPINTASMAGFASLHNFPIGKIYNKWGSALTLFRTSLGTPYFFNLHSEKSGNSIIFDANGEHLAIRMTNFLLSEAHRFHPKICLIDSHRKSELFCDAISSKYYQINKKDAPNYLSINPLLLSDKEEHKKFLVEWFKLILNVQEATDFINNAVEKIYTLPEEHRVLNNYKLFFDSTQLTEPMLTSLAKWIENGEYAHIFNNDSNNIANLLDRIYAIDFYELAQKEEQIRIPIFHYILFTYYTQLIGDPAIFAATGCLNFDDSKQSYEAISSLLKKITERNSASIFTSHFPAQAGIGNDQQVITEAHKQNLQHIAKMFDTRIFFPTFDFTSDMSKILGFDKTTYKIFQGLKPVFNQFLLQQDAELIIAELNLTGMPSLISILDNSEEAKKMITEIKKELETDNPEKWLPKYYKAFMS